MNKELEKILKKLNGNLIGIGIKEEKLINLIEKNKNILECNLLDCFEKDSEEKSKFKKIKINYMICNFDRIKDIQNKIIYDSIYICNKEVIIYSKSNNELENLIRRYSRYSNIETMNYNDGNIYKISIIKNISKFNEIYNKIIDGMISIVDFISNLLV